MGLIQRGKVIVKVKVVVIIIVIVLVGQSASMPQNGGGGNMSKRRVSNAPSSANSGQNNNANHIHRHHNKATSPPPTSSPSLELQKMLNKWTSTCLRFFEYPRCTSSNLGSDEDCYKLSSVKRSQIAVYLGYNHNENGESGKDSELTLSPGETGKVYAILPDSNSMKANGAHDVVLILDPYSHTHFGHFVAMFFIDFETEFKDCNENFQIHLTDGTCVTMGRKPRCPNLVEKLASNGFAPKRCHIDFLPTVYPLEKVVAPLKANSSQDLLECVQLQGFAPCPQLRSLDDTMKVLCDASESNSKRCDTSHSGVGTRCKLFQTCDRAILIGGGWNRHHSALQSLHNIATVESALKSSGFLADNIDTFYANGKPHKTLTSKSSQGASRRSRGISSGYFSSAMKTALRGHLRTMCETRHCADTLFIYLNNPTTFEGDMLLWDVDYNGIADELETYTLKEFLWDLSGCEAKRVFLLVDQGNSELLIKSLKSSVDHPNIIILAVGPSSSTTSNHKFSRNGELTKIWTNANNSHPMKCLNGVKTTMDRLDNNDSLPEFYDATQGLSEKVSLVGAPCGLNPPVSYRELKSLYQGCQNVPTSIWFSFDFEDIGDDVNEEEIVMNGSREMSIASPQYFVASEDDQNEDRDNRRIINKPS